MKNVLLSAFILVINVSLKAQTTHVISESGFAYDPASLTIVLGDSVRFNGSSAHPVLQVSEDTWNSNGITPLSGGFSFASGKGTVGFPNAGIFYYVCTAHVASNNMKGKITVTTPTATGNVSSENKLAVFPVPMEGDILNILLDGEEASTVMLDVFDVAGALRISMKNVDLKSGRFQLDCSSLAKGEYILRITSPHAVYNSKITR